MTIAHKLSELVLNTRRADLPESSCDAAVKMLLDTLGCAYPGRHAPGIDELVDLECSLSAAGLGTVFLDGRQLALPSAAFCNSAMLHAMDFDNNYPGADLHIMSIVVPVAFACAEESAADGRDCLAAIVLGVEAAARIAKPYMRAKRRHHYFLTTSLVGGWGGVAAAARLLGLSPAHTVHAMGIYYAHTCGNRQALLERALTKRMQPAIAAKAALYSVLLAQTGFTGPEQAFEGPGGFYRSYTLDPPPPLESFAAPAAPYGIEELVVKQFPTCGFNHGCIASGLHLKREYGFTFADIDHVEFFLREGGGTLQSMPFVAGAFPQVDAQFCAPYAIAMALNKGTANVADFDNKTVMQDRDTMDLAARTLERTSFADMDLKDYPVARKGYTYTKVYLRNGVSVEHEYDHREFSNPAIMDLERVEDKFRQCVAAYGGMPSKSAGELIAAIKQFQEARSIGEFIQDWMECRGGRPQ